MRQVLKYVACFLVYGSIGVLIAVLITYGAHVRSLPEIKVWHTAHLDADTVRTLADYRKLEERFFAQLGRDVYGKVSPEDERRYNRYSAGSPSDPAARGADWNRTFELAAPEARAGILLLHGLSDSPYSVRALAELLHALRLETYSKLDSQGRR